MQIALATAAYVVVTCVVQGASHFVFAARHYATVSYLRDEPVIALGVLSMLVQGAILGNLYRLTAPERRSIRTAVGLSLTMGAFLASYIALAEAGKYQVPSTPSWIAVEVASAAVQFALNGVTLHFVFARSSERVSV